MAVKLPNDVKECLDEIYKEYLDTERQLEERPRQIAWHSYVGHKSGSASFWRHGFAKRFKARLAKGADHTIIPGYDMIATNVASECPEWTDRSDELWGFLLSPYTPRLARKDFYEQAIILTADSGTDDTSTVCIGNCDW